MSNVQFMLQPYFPTSMSPAKSWHTIHIARQILLTHDFPVIRKAVIILLTSIPGILRISVINKPLILIQSREARSKFS